jgi:hypothetical protein
MEKRGEMQEEEEENRGGRKGLKGGREKRKLQFWVSKHRVAVLPFLTLSL